MSEYIYERPEQPAKVVRDGWNVRIEWDFKQREEIIRCRDCKHLDDSEYERWDNTLAEAYGEPPLFCDLFSVNEWRMDGDRRVAETSFAEVEPDGFCKWGISMKL